MCHEPHFTQRFELWWQQEAPVLALENRGRALWRQVARCIVCNGALLNLFALRQADHDLFIALKQMWGLAVAGQGLYSLNHFMLDAA